MFSEHLQYDNIPPSENKFRPETKRKIIPFFFFFSMLTLDTRHRIHLHIKEYYRLTTLL